MARPTVFTPETVSRLEEIFKVGANDTEACLYANISRDSYYDKLKSDPEFSDRMTAAKDFSILAAKKTLVKAVLEGDKQSAQWLLERRRKEEYAPRQELSGPEGVPLGYIHSGDLKELQVEETKALPDAHKP